MHFQTIHQYTEDDGMCCNACENRSKMVVIKIKKLNLIGILKWKVAATADTWKTHVNDVNVFNSITSPIK